MACDSRPFGDFRRCSYCLLGQDCPWRPGGLLDMGQVPFDIVSRGMPLHSALRSATLTKVDDE